MTKVLMMTHMASMIEQFNRNNLKILLNLGYEVHIAANFVSQHNTMTPDQLSEFKNELEIKGIFVHQIDFERGFGSIKANMRVWRQLSDLLKANAFDFIHCQSPIGGVFGRLIGHKFKVPVIYTAHGFQFFKGGSLKDWFVFYPIERFLARFTKVLITINNEDTKVAERFNQKLRVVHIPGVGINYKRFVSESQNVDKRKIRKDLGIPEDAFVVISVGELSERKNHSTILKAINELKDKRNIYYIICGIGEEKDNLQKLASQLGFSNHLKLLGYRKDIPSIYGASDICAFPSLREGLGLAGVEAMAGGLPIVTSNLNGILDYSVDGVTGFLNDPLDSHGFAESIKKLLMNKRLRMTIKKNNIDSAKVFDVNNVNKKMYRIYRQIVL